jgi:pimeloyl-ACP methyl ester carboxylesterase
MIHKAAFRPRQMSTQTRAAQTYRLSNGRILGFAEYGDPKGTPLLYFHGFPSSRLEGSFASAIAQRHGIRIIALDRPGFGLSTPHPHRSILDWTSDVQDFAQGFDIPRFAVLGLSGGGPYALACAYKLPYSMLTGVGLFASGPPWVAGKQHIEWYRLVMRWMSMHWPTGLRVVLDALVGVLRWVATSGPVTRRVDAWLERECQKEESESPEDNAGTSVKRPAEARRQDLYHMLIDEPFAQGAAATVQEAELLSSHDWGFRFEDVECPVRVWHGGKDANAPAVMIRYMIERLPHGIYREFKDDTHYTMFKHLEEAITALIPNNKSAI